MSRLQTAPGRSTTPGVRQTSSTESLVACWQTFSDAHAREILVQRYMPLSRKLARKFQGSSEIFDDLAQVACIGLVKAIDRFDTERGVSFETFAIPTILGELKRYLRDNGWAVHVPRALQEQAVKVEHARRELAANGSSPTYRELAEYMELPLEEVLEAVEASAAHHATSLETPRNEDTGGESTITLGDTISTEDERFELVDVATSLGAAAKHLTERERYVLALRFIEDRTQAEIAEQIGLSQMQVSRILRQALTRLETLMRGQSDSG